MTRPRRLLAVVASLRGGGAERVLAGIASAAAEEGHDVTVLTLFPPYADDYPLHSACRRISLHASRSTTSLMRATMNNLVRIARLRKVMVTVSPDVVLSFMDTTNVLSIVAALGLQARVVVSERIDPRVHRLGFPWPLLRRLAYRLADAVVVQTESVATGWARPRFGHERVHVIPNPLLLPVRDAMKSESSGHLLAVGRLDRQKGFDGLIRAYAIAAAGGLSNPLVIVGEGPERGALESLVQHLQLADRVSLPGWSARVEQWFEGAHAFVLSSRYEGFPNALLEALAYGLPSVATDCLSGPAELLAGGAGLLVPVDDIQQLAKGIMLVCTDDATRSTLSACARKAAARYAIHAVMAHWTRVLQPQAATELSASTLCAD